MTWQAQGEIKEMTAITLEVPQLFWKGNDILRLLIRFAYRCEPQFILQNLH